VVGLVVALLGVQAGVVPQARAADVAPRMYQGQAFPTAGSSPTEDKPQSKLWFADGSWWALMRTSTNGADRTPDVTVHELQDDHTWRDTGALVDRRAGSTGDALWEGGKLYVASRSTSGAVQVGRLSFDPATDTYAMDAGFPVVIGAGSVESVTIARDSLRRLWVTYTEPDPVDATLDRVIVAHSTADDTTWTAPFAVPVPDSTVKADDISAIVAFSGKVGVMWSDQQNEVIRFAVHPDTAVDGSGWTMETALDGTRSADDHLNLKSLLEDDAGRVYAAVKTSRGDSSADSPSDPGIRVLTRSTTGGWTAATAAAVGDGLTRPQLALDATNRELYVVMSTESGGNVYYKKSPLGASLSFPAGTPGETLLTWPGALINDATTAKAPITAESGLVVLASDDKSTKRYYHAELDLNAVAADSVAPSVPSGVTAIADSVSQVTVRWAGSADAVGVASYRVLRDGAVMAQAVTSLSFVDTTVAAGRTYSYTVSAVDAAGNRSAESEPAAVQVPAAAAGVLVRGSTQAGSTAVTRTVPVPRPAGVVAGDVLIAQINADDAPGMGAVPAGWSPVVEPLSMGTNARLFVYHRVVTDVAVEPASYVWQLATAEKWNAVLTAFGGVDAANPFDTPAGTAVTAQAGSTLTVPGVSTVTAGALLVGGVGANNAKLSVTQPAGFTELREARGAQVTEQAAQARPTAGATGPATWRLSASYTAAGWLRALRPATS
jgi:hypothetical protein